MSGQSIWLPGSEPQLVSSLPSNPHDGQEVYYQADATNGVLWYLRYNANSSSAFKWEFVDGSDLTVRKDTTFTSATGATVQTYADIDTTNLALTAPLGGDYTLDWGTRPACSAGATFSVYVAPKVGTSAAVDTDALVFTFHSGVGAGGRTEMHANRKIRVTGVAAGALIKMQLRADASITSAAALNVSWMSMRPVRVG